MPESTSRPLTCSVLFAELADYARLQGASEEDGASRIHVCDPEGARG